MSREQLLERLRSLPAERPATKMGQVRWAWPEIQAARAAGHTLQRVHQRLKDAGIEIGYRTLSLYIGRLSREYQCGRRYSGAAALQARNEKSQAVCSLVRPPQMARAVSASNTSSPAQRDFVAFTAIRRSLPIR